MDNLAYSREYINQKLAEEDSEFINEIYSYLKKYQYSLLPTSSGFSVEDREDIMQEAVYSFVNEYPRISENVAVSTYINKLYLRVSTNYYSEKYEVSRKYRRIILAIERYSVKYDIPITEENYYKFRRLVGESIQVIDKALAHRFNTKKVSLDELNKTNKS